MNREIRIIKRAARDLSQAGRAEKAEASGRDELKEPSLLQMTRTIRKWVSARRRNATEELLAARSLGRLGT